MDSQAGCCSDEWATIANNDILKHGNQQPLYILIIGKPRSGKSTVAKALCKELDLVHINIETWLTALQKKVAEYEPPEINEEEGEVAPKWMTDLEEEVWNALKVGKATTDE